MSVEYGCCFFTKLTRMQFINQANESLNIKKNHTGLKASTLFRVNGIYKVVEFFHWSFLS